MKDEGLSNIYINKILTPTTKYYKGIYASDSIPPELWKEEKFSFICNLSKSSNVGSHWITIVGEKKYVYYLDSFGLTCFIADICNFLKKCNRTILINTKRIQSYGSIFCGFYCIYFVYCNEFNIKKEMFFRPFSTNFIDNDKIVIKKINFFIRKL